MSKKLILIIVALFIVQYGLFTYIEVKVRPQEISEQERNNFQSEYGIFLDKKNNLYGGQNGVLSLSSKRLNEVPDMVYHIGNIQVIDLSNNNFTEFPYKLLTIKGLKKIYFGDNQLTSIDFSNVENSEVTELDLSRNLLFAINALEKLDDLQRLNLTRNSLVNMPNISSKQLQEVDLSFNKIEKAEGKIGENISILKMINNELSEFNIEVSGREQLNTLVLSSNYNLSQLNTNIGKLKNLRELQLNNCNFSTLNNTILSSNSLEQLYLSDNHINELTIRNTDLKNLITCDLSDNILKRLTIESLSIQELYLGNNKLIETNLSLKLKNAFEISLINNNLSKLPSTALYAPKLEYLNLYDNPMTVYEIDEIGNRLLIK